MTKKVLLLSTYYPPSSASGIHRVAANSKYLQRFGWMPYVVTKLFSEKHPHNSYDPRLEDRPDPCPVYRLDYPQIRLLSIAENYFWKMIGGADDNRKPYIFYRRMLRCATRLIIQDGIEAIWATSRGPVVHRVAHRLHCRFKIPWIADFRDLPDQTYDNRDTRLAVNQELRACASASLLTTTTEELAAALKGRHSMPVFVIPNGYDPDDYVDIPRHAVTAPPERFSIDHFGVLYQYRNPDAVFSAIDLLLARHRQYEAMEINFYGADPGIVRAFAAGHACEKLVKCPGRLSYADMLKRQLQSQILLVVSPPEQGGAIPAKIYSYLASKRPILVVPGDRAGTERIIASTQAGLCSGAPLQIADWITELHKQWRQDGQTMFRGIDAAIAQYSRIHQAGKLAELLDGIQEKKSTSTG